jgi:hypothetical protein
MSTKHVPKDVDADSVPEFCRRHRISEAFAYKLWAKGEGPEVMRVGKRTLVPREAQARWRAARTKPAHID